MRNERLDRLKHFLQRAVVVSALMLPPTVGARAVPNQAQIQEGERMAEAVRVDRTPKLDGTLDDPLWQSAKAITDFRQREPHEAGLATERTEVRVLFTRHAVYFGIHCYDSEPSRIIATELRRDVSQELDDYFEILIDSNHDRRDAYVFQVNPLGTQSDGLIVAEQSNSEEVDFDSGWDGVWISEARIVPDGWTATIEIPFTTLNFTKSKDVVWGLNFKRFIRRKNEEDTWAAYRRTFGIRKVSEAGELRGITDIGSGRLFIVKPYGLAQYDKRTGQNVAFPLTGGLDVKYGIRSNMVLNVFRDGRGSTAVQSDSFSDFHSRKTAILSGERWGFRFQSRRTGQTILQPANWDRFGHWKPSASEWRRETDGHDRPLAIWADGCGHAFEWSESIRELRRSTVKGVAVGWFVCRTDGHRQAVWQCVG